MSTNETLIALADRVETLDGPDRSVDIEIWATCVANQQQLNLVQIGRSLHGDSEANFRADRMSDGRRYTGSLDDALSLVPERWTPRQMNFSAPCADNRKWTLNLFGGKEGGRCGHSEAATPALALTAAALRARAMLSEREKNHG